jgi:iron complex outermembrane receptor protein
MSGKNRRAWLWNGACAVAIVVSLAASPAFAQSYTFDIPAQSLSDSLRDYARVSGQQIIFTNDLVAGQNGRRLQGSYSPADALSELLAGTGLVVERSSSGALMIRRERHAAADEPILASTAMVSPRMVSAAPEPEPAGVEQVVVSSSRLQSAGFDAPTPTTVLSAADLEASAQPNVFDALTRLPALQGSTGASYNTATTTTGLQGLSALNLRGLSPLRTLVLLDSQRVVSANFNGVVDVSQLPQLLLQRVDIVTGGASASWGSDAIAGVVNFVTEKKFEGFKSNAMAGLSTYGDDGNVTLQMAAGTSFLGGRGHFEVASEYSYSAGVQPSPPYDGAFGVRPNWGGRNFQSQQAIGSYASIAATPAGQPQFNFGNVTQNTTFASYGLVTNGPKIGTTFGPSGMATPFAYAGSCSVTRTATTGTLSGAIGSLCFATPSNPGDQSDAHQNDKSLVDPLVRGNIYSRVSYDLSPSTEIYATLNFSQVRAENISAVGTTGRTGLSIRCDNAYLPDTALFGAGLTQAATTAACLSNYPSGGLTFGTYGGNLGTAWRAHLQRDQRRYVIGATGTFDVFDTDWSWDSYFEHGESDTSIRITGIPLLPRFNQALDSVRNASGDIVCRNATAQLNGCVPYNPFGSTVASKGTIQYMENQDSGSNFGPTAIQTQRQEAFSFSVNGSPMQNWAGKISVAAGLEYREEGYTQRGDPYGGGISSSTPATSVEPCTDPALDCAIGNNWLSGNFHNGAGTYHVTEAFTEVGVPILNDDFWGKIDLDVAGRVADYSTAGQVNTWKVGATWDTPIPGVRLRALQSRDVRAPNLSELFSPVQNLPGTVNNNFTGIAGQNIRSLNEGNSLLKAEKAQTTEVGVVFQPDWLSGFQASVDYYRISVKGMISALSAQQVEDLCFNGAASYCDQSAITTANGVNQSAANPGGVGAANQITQIHLKAYNQAGVLTDGFDIEASYHFTMDEYGIPGDFTLRSLANRVSKYLSNSGIVGQAQNVELAGVLGSISGLQTYNQTGGNILNWKLTETQGYQNDTWGVTLTERWYAGGTIQSKNFIVCAPGTCPAPTIQNPTINFNKVSSAFYLDIGASWNVSDKAQVYGKIDNLTNLAPPLVGNNYANNALYDVIGRAYRIGVRLNY